MKLRKTKQTLIRFVLWPKWKRLWHTKWDSLLVRRLTWVNNTPVIVSCISSSYAHSFIHQRVLFSVVSSSKLFHADTYCGAYHGGKVCCCCVGSLRLCSGYPVSGHSIIKGCNSQCGKGIGCIIQNPWLQFGQGIQLLSLLFSTWKRREETARKRGRSRRWRGA